MRMKKLKRLCQTYTASFARSRERTRVIRLVERKIKESSEFLPELTEEQEKEIRTFWEKHGYRDIPLQWHRFFYGKTGQVRPDFIPTPIFSQQIKPAMNNVSYGAVWSDKSYLDYFLRGIPTARCVLRNVNGRFLDEQFQLVDRKEAEEILNRYDALVVKPAVDTNTGRGVALLYKPYTVESIIASHRKNFVVQLPLRQHPDMGQLNASSVNTIRINSVLLEKDAHVMSAFVKVGQAGAFADNSGHDRYFIGIRENGTYMDYAIDHNLNKYTEIPSGYTFAGQKVPCFDKVCQMIEQAHRQVAHFGFAFWDVCVGEDGEPVVVEMNLKNPDSMIPQVATGPLFGKYAEQVLDYVRRS